MYKGKFDQKAKGTPVDIEELLAQRKLDIPQPSVQASEPAPKAKPALSPSEAPAEKSAVQSRPARSAADAAPDISQVQAAQRSPSPKQEEPAASKAPKAPAGTAPKVPAEETARETAPTAPVNEAPQKPVSKPVPKASAPRPQQSVQQAKPSGKKKKKKKGPRLGGTIFYTVYFLFILLFFIATFIGLGYVRGWLSAYEAAQPGIKAEQVFTQLFTNPDWEALYVASGAADSPYEGKEAFVNYMNARVDPSQLSYLETSAGLSGDKKFVVRMGTERVATYTLTDRNPNPKAGNLSDLIRIPDWQLEAVEVFFQRTGTYRIEKLKEQTAYVNGVKLNDNFTIQEATTAAQNYLPAGVSALSLCTQEVTGLMLTPTVQVLDANGTPVDVSYDEDTHTFTVRTAGNTISEEERQVALDAAEASCKWMIRAITDRATLGRYFDSNGNAYKTMVSSELTWTQKNNGYSFLNEEVTNYTRYTEDLFSVRVSLTLEVKVAIDGSTKTIPYAQSLFFQRTGGKWLCYEAVNRDVSEPVGKIRLTFMQGSTVLLTDFFQTDASQLITPVITPPEGKVFSGWVRQDISESGQTTLTVVFQPDESGTVSIPEGTVLTPMVLYALFEDANTAHVG